MSNRIKDYSKLFSVEAADKIKIESIKKSLSEGFPVLIGMSCPLSFQVASTDLWVPQESRVGTYMGHAMCVIGYDDDKYDGAFEIMNSWGTDWGNNGFIWVKYSDLAAFTHYGYEMVQDINSMPVVTNKPVNKEIYLSGKMRLINERGKEMPAQLKDEADVLRYQGKSINNYYLTDIYPSGTRFRIYLENDVPAYVYLIASDTSGKVNRIFPSGNNISPLMNYRINEIAIPDEDYFIQMDNTRGVDYLCMLYSKEPLDINEVQRRIEGQQGTFREKVFKALADKIVSSNNVTQDRQGIVFSARSNEKTLLPVIVVIRHN
jgi:hypothetical protein